MSDKGMGSSNCQTLNRNVPYLHAKHKPAVTNLSLALAWQALSLPGESIEGRPEDDNQSLGWKERKGPSAGGYPHQRAQGVVKFFLPWGI